MAISDRGLGLALLGYAAFFAVGYHLFVLFYEEPTLKRLFGAEYTRYCEVVPRWIPKVRNGTLQT